eukprot:GDKJ01045646.1.p1 GENE.GDKJ01045646.1~~GDKJ01045646.1.p1  ORF type:complete len:1578 (-),score=409.78 GDKJ01045646.1:115-4848(-)
MWKSSFSLSNPFQSAGSAPVPNSSKVVGGKKTSRIGNASPPVNKKENTSLKGLDASSVTGDQHSIPVLPDEVVRQILLSSEDFDEDQLEEASFERYQQILSKVSEDLVVGLVVTDLMPPTVNDKQNLTAYYNMNQQISASAQAKFRDGSGIPFVSSVNRVPLVSPIDMRILESPLWGFDVEGNVTESSKTMGNSIDEGIQTNGIYEVNGNYPSSSAMGFNPDYEQEFGVLLENGANPFNQIIATNDILSTNDVNVAYALQDRERKLLQQEKEQGLLQSTPTSSHHGVLIQDNEGLSKINKIKSSGIQISQMSTQVPNKCSLLASSNQLTMVGDSTLPPFSHFLDTHSLLNESRKLPLITTLPPNQNVLVSSYDQRAKKKSVLSRKRSSNVEPHNNSDLPFRLSSESGTSSNQQEDEITPSQSFSQGSSSSDKNSSDQYDHFLARRSSLDRSTLPQLNKDKNDIILRNSISQNHQHGNVIERNSTASPCKSRPCDAYPLTFKNNHNNCIEDLLSPVSFYSSPDPNHDRNSKRGFTSAHIPTMDDQVTFQNNLHHQSIDSDQQHLLESHPMSPMSSVVLSPRILPSPASPFSLNNPPNISFGSPPINSSVMQRVLSLNSLNMTALECNNSASPVSPYLQPNLLNPSGSGSNRSIRLSGSAQLPPASHLPTNSVFSIPSISNNNANTSNQNNNSIFGKRLTSLGSMPSPLRRITNNTAPLVPNCGPAFASSIAPPRPSPGVSSMINDEIPSLKRRSSFEANSLQFQTSFNRAVASSGNGSLQARRLSNSAAASRSLQVTSKASANTSHNDKMGRLWSRLTSWSIARGSDASAAVESHQLPSLENHFIVNKPSDEYKIVSLNDPLTLPPLDSVKDVHSSQNHSANLMNSSMRSGANLNTVPSDAKIRQQRSEDPSSIMDVLQKFSSTKTSAKFGVDVSYLNQQFLSGNGSMKKSSYSVSAQDVNLSGSHIGMPMDGYSSSNVENQLSWKGVHTLNVLDKLSSAQLQQQQHDGSNDKDANGVVGILSILDPSSSAVTSNNLGMGNIFSSSSYPTLQNNAVSHGQSHLMTGNLILMAPIHEDEKIINTSRMNRLRTHLDDQSKHSNQIYKHLSKRFATSTSVNNNNAFDNSGMFSNDNLLFSWDALNVPEMMMEGFESPYLANKRFKDAPFNLKGMDGFHQQLQRLNSDQMYQNFSGQNKSASKKLSWNQKDQALYSSLNPQSVVPVSSEAAVSNLSRSAFSLKVLDGQGPTRWRDGCDCYEGLKFRVRVIAKMLRNFCSDVRKWFIRGRLPVLGTRLHTAVMCFLFIIHLECLFIQCLAAKRPVFLVSMFILPASEIFVAASLAYWISTSNPIAGRLVVSFTVVSFINTFLGVTLSLSQMSSASAISLFLASQFVVIIITKLLIVYFTNCHLGRTELLDHDNTIFDIEGQFEEMTKTAPIIMNSIMKGKMIDEDSSNKDDVNHFQMQIHSQNNLFAHHHQKTSPVMVQQENLGASGSVHPFKTENGYSSVLFLEEQSQNAKKNEKSLSEVSSGNMMNGSNNVNPKNSNSLGMNDLSIGGKGVSNNNNNSSTVMNGQTSPPPI